MSCNVSKEMKNKNRILKFAGISAEMTNNSPKENVATRECVFKSLRKGFLTDFALALILPIDYSPLHIMQFEH